MSEFDSAWLKWGQAVKHAQWLEADIDAFAKDHPTLDLMLRTEYHPKRHGFGIYVDSIEPTPIRWGLMLGDIANNYRSALDHLAWTLVGRGKTPHGDLTDAQRRLVYFPLEADPVGFRKKIPKKLPGVTPADLAKVRRYQPYQRGQRRRRWHVYTVLIEINNRDKHQTLHPVWNVPNSGRYEITHLQDCELSRSSPTSVRVPLEIGTELTCIRVRKTGPNPNIVVAAEINAQPSIDTRLWLKEWLFIIRGWTFLLLQEFAEPPQHLLEIGIDWETVNLDPDSYRLEGNS